MIRPFALAAALVALALLILFALPVRAHQAPATPERPDGWFYSRYCCNELDCHQALPGQVQEIAGGFLVWKALPVNWHDYTQPPRVWQIVPNRAPEFVPYGDKRILASGDHHVHVCELQGAETMRCLYIPAMF